MGFLSGALGAIGEQVRQKNLLDYAVEHEANQAMAKQLFSMAENAEPELAPDLIKGAYAYLTAKQGESKKIQKQYNLPDLVLRHTQAKYNPQSLEAPPEAQQVGHTPPVPFSPDDPGQGTVDDWMMQQHAAATDAVQQQIQKANEVLAQQRLQSNAPSPLSGTTAAGLSQYTNPPTPMPALPGGAPIAFPTLQGQPGGTPGIVSDVNFQAIPELGGRRKQILSGGRYSALITPTEKAAAAARAEITKRQAEVDFARQLGITDPREIANFLNKQALKLPEPPGTDKPLELGGKYVVVKDKNGKYVTAWQAPDATETDKPVVVPLGSRLATPGGKVLLDAGEKPETAGSFEQQRYGDYIQNFKDTHEGREPTAAEKIVLRTKMLDAEANARTPEDLDQIRRLNAALMGRLLAPPASDSSSLNSQTQQRVQEVAQRVESGQITVSEGQALLGGQRGGLGGALVDELTHRNSLIIAPKRREAVNNVNIGIGQLDTLQELVNNVQRSTGADRLKNTKLLEDYADTITARLARANGEVGVLTEQDVGRAKSLVAGWKAANFAPGYAKQEIDLLRRNYGKVKEALLNFDRYPATGSPSGGGPGLPAPPSTEKIRVRRKADGKTGTINPSDFDAAKYDKL